MIEQRTYRNQFSKQRFRSFVVTYKETDLWIGFDPESFREEMKDAALAKVIALRTEMEAYLLKDPTFGRTFEPHRVEPNAPEIVRLMAEAANRGGVGADGFCGWRFLGNGGASFDAAVYCSGNCGREWRRYISKN